MDNLRSPGSFYEQPILNSPYEAPRLHHEMDPSGGPTNIVIHKRRKCSLVSPYPKPRKATRSKSTQLELDARNQTITGEDEDRLNYALTTFVNEVRSTVGEWRKLSNPDQWNVTPTTRRLLEHWRTHEFRGIKPFFCQLEAVETLIWLTEVAPKGVQGKGFLSQIEKANKEANPDLYRIAMKLATGAGKTTVMAMIIAWQTLNAVRSPGSTKYSRGFLVVAPGITIRDRLNVLRPEDPEAYYADRELVPVDMLPDMGSALVKITNYHAFKLRETVEISKGGRRAIEGREGKLASLETEGQMVQRVAGDLMSLGPIVVLNDEAHHCYRERPDNQEVNPLKGDEKKQAESDNEAARLWINGIEAFNRVLSAKGKRKGGVLATYDLSATPFFLRGSGYIEGTLFPWVVSDFSLMDAIECGIVKLPRMPVSDNTMDGEVPKFRNLWEQISEDAGLPKKGRKANDPSLDPSALPILLQSALDNLYGHYAGEFKRWEDAGIGIPPVLIVVCNNTATSKLVYDYISGYERQDEQGQPLRPVLGQLSLFSNFNETTGNRNAKPNTILVDSVQLESGEEVDKDFRDAFSTEIEQFRREVAQREGAERANKITDTDILREVMNTVGKRGKLGAQIRCVVSVSMLTEGWDANNVTHILGVRAFGTQLLCEQVVGRGLRRSSYQLNDDGLFDVEYAEVLGIPFEFTTKQTVQSTKPTQLPKIRVEALDERMDLEITFPRLVGYRKELPDSNLVANIDALEDYLLTPKTVGPGETDMEGIVGKGYIMRPELSQSDRQSSILYNLSKFILETYFRDGPQAEPRMYLFPQIRRIVRTWIKTKFKPVGNVRPSTVFEYREIREQVCKTIFDAITVERGEVRVVPHLDPYNPRGSSKYVGFNIAHDTNKWSTSPRLSHVNYCVLDSDWEGEACRAIEGHPAVRSYVKNHALGFEIPYTMDNQDRLYRPDFIIRVEDGRGEDDLLNLILEIKGFRGQDVSRKNETVQNLWLPAVNGIRKFGRWAFAEFHDHPYEIRDRLHALIQSKIEENT